MSKFQQGSLFKLKRKSVPDGWIFRWHEYKRTYKKQIIGSVTKLRNRREPQPRSGRTGICSERMENSFGA
jgi:hypothetical protein